MQVYIVLYHINVLEVTGGLMVRLLDCKAKHPRFYPHHSRTFFFSFSALSVPQMFSYLTEQNQIPSLSLPVPLALIPSTYLPLQALAILFWTDSVTLWQQTPPSEHSMRTRNTPSLSSDLGLRNWTGEQWTLPQWCHSNRRCLATSSPTASLNRMLKRWGQRSDSCPLEMKGQVVPIQAAEMLQSVPWECCWNVNPLVDIVTSQLRFMAI